MRARRTMWWTLPFLVFFVLLALFLFLIFQRTTSATSGGIGSSPATSSAPFEASAERPVEKEEGKKNEEPTKAPSAAVTTPAAEVASPSAQMRAETQKKNQTTTKTPVTRRKEQVATGQVLVVGGVDDLVATYAANEKDDRQRAASEAADPVESASLSGAALVARHLVAADGEATAERRGDGNVLAAYRHCHGSDVPLPLPPLSFFFLLFYYLFMFLIYFIDL
jgi:cytoskeletal protein RodZ